ncbi:MAG: class C sortase [Eubacteriales bacterium]|nr:class C sortase [Eubacteriales bacterium]
MKRITWRRVGFVLLFLLGLSILLYPLISDRWNRYRAGLLLTDYTQTVNSAAPETYEEDLKKVQAYNESLIGSIVPDAFAVREGEHDEEYESMLNVSGDGVMGHVDIPAIDIRLPIYHYTFPEILQKGAGHLFGSSMPIGGESTHAVITAHRGLPSAKLFTDLNLLKEGDEFYIYVYNEILAYEIDQIQTVEPDQTGSLAITPGKDYVTLLTCTPYGVNTHRLLVRGHRVPYVKMQEKKTVLEDLTRRGPSILIEVLCALGGILAAVLLVKLLDRCRKKK